MTGHEGRDDQATAQPGAYVPIRGSASISKSSYVPGAGRLPIYLARGGGLYTSGADDSAANTSSVVASTGRDSVSVAGYTGDDAEWAAVTGCLRDQFERWNVEITDVEPASGPYLEVAFGAGGEELGMTTYAGVAPIDANECRLIDRAVVFVFAADLGGARAVCEAAAQAIGHAASLDHAYLCADPMSYLEGCGDKAFQDVDASCGGYDEQPCICGRTAQNSVRVLDEHFGLAGAGGSPAGPACGATTYQGGCDASGVLSWCQDGSLRTLQCADYGSECAFVDDAVGNDCVAPTVADACMGVDYYGQCSADGVLSYCYDGQLATIDCGAQGNECGYQDATTGYNCLVPPGTDNCMGIDYFGQCENNVLTWCDAGELQTLDCTAQGQTCAYQNDTVGYNCL